MLSKIRSGCEFVGSKVRPALKSFCPLAIVAALAVIGMASPAHAQITLPDTGVDVAAHIDEAITALGTVAVTAVGGYFAFLVVRMALRWGRTAVR